MIKKELLLNVNETNPIVHCITNYVTVNDCANIILAAGGSPIMADDFEEVEEITSISNALVINIGTLNKRTIPSMKLAAKKANELKIPIVFDPVGVGASKLRTTTALDIIKSNKIAVIRGNASEIKCLALGSGSVNGVDANKEDQITKNNLQTIVNFSKKLSIITGAIIVVTGEIDIVVSNEKVCYVKNGYAMMSKVTGTGCMLTSLIGAFVGANKKEVMESTILAIITMGLSGELAFDKLKKIDAGTSTYRNLIIDEVSKMTFQKIIEGGKFEGI